MHKLCPALFHLQICMEIKVFNCLGPWCSCDRFGPSFSPSVAAAVDADDDNDDVDDDGIVDAFFL